MSFNGISSELIQFFAEARSPGWSPFIAIFIFTQVIMAWWVNKQEIGFAPACSDRWLTLGVIKEEVGRLRYTNDTPNLFSTTISSRFRISIRFFFSMVFPFNVTIGNFFFFQIATIEKQPNPLLLFSFGWPWKSFSLPFLLRF